MPATYNEGQARARILAVIAAVASIGKTHDYERFADDWETLVALYQATIGSSTQLRGWNISLAGVDPHEQETFGGPGAVGTVEVTYDYRVRGYMAVDDAVASEKTFATLAIAVMAALDAEPKLHSSKMDDGAAGNFYGPPAASLRLDFRMFGEVLVHYAELQQIVKEVV